MNYLAVGLSIGFYAGFLSLMLVRHLASKGTEQEEYIEPRAITKKPRKVKQRRINLKPSMRNGRAA